MSSFVMIVLIAGVIYLALFHKPRPVTDDDLKKWFGSQLSSIADQLEQDIEKDENGEYPHAGRLSFDKRGSIIYVLQDKHHARLEVSDKNRLNIDDIKQTEGYRKLQQKTQSLGLSMMLEENEVEGDGVDTFNELDEYIDDFPRYYSVTISGW